MLPIHLICQEISVNNPPIAARILNVAEHTASALVDEQKSTMPATMATRYNETYWRRDEDQCNTEPNSMTLFVAQLYVLPHACQHDEIVLQVGRCDVW